MQSNSKLGPKLFTINLAHELILNTPAKTPSQKLSKPSSLFVKSIKALQMLQSGKEYISQTTVTAL